MKSSILDGSRPILFVGESWLGSSARSLREALVRSCQLVEEISIDSIFPRWSGLALRGAMRIGEPLIAKDLRRVILEKLDQVGPALVVMYKCPQVGEDLVDEIRHRGSRTVNVYPDCSPLSQGKGLRIALGAYDLVVSTKHWHVAAWHELFGYSNLCKFIPHGYDPMLHYQAVDESKAQPIDVLLVATYRAEYADLILDLSRCPGMGDLQLELRGPGWKAIQKSLPSRWRVGQGVHGHAYRHLVSLAKTCIAPVTRNVLVDGKRYPGDDDTTRTYELPAMGAFMIHRRTSYVATLYEDAREVMMYDDPMELAEHIRWAIQNPVHRHSMRLAAQRRCVPRDSLDQRAQALGQLLNCFA